MSQETIYGIPIFTPSMILESEDGVINAYSPEVPGAFAWGISRDQARDNFQQALTQFLQHYITDDLSRDAVGVQSDTGEPICLDLGLRLAVTMKTERLRRRLSLDDFAQSLDIPEGLLRIIKSADVRKILQNPAVASHVDLSVTTIQHLQQAGSNLATNGANHNNDQFLAEA